MYVVFSKPNCNFCVKAEQLLTAKKIQFETIKLDVGQEKETGQKYVSRDELIKKIPSARTMPQILKCENGVETYIGGFSELQSALTQ